jgi:small subunit ribosomal protein S27Ae
MVQQKVDGKKGLWDNYDVKDGKLVRHNPYSPKAGTGYLMAVHKNRKTCGKTGYTKFSSQEE